MSATCRSTTCCDPLVNGLGGVVIATPENNSGEGGIDPHCTTPTVTLTASKAEVLCGEPFTLSWSSTDVGTGGTVTISPTVGSVDVDTADSDSLTLTATTTYTITATNACGESATATVTVTLKEPTLFLEVGSALPQCAQGELPYVEWYTLDIYPSKPAVSTVVITTSVAVTGFPKTVPINTGGRVTFSQWPSQDVTFTLTVTTPCGVYTEADMFNYINPQSNLVLTAEQDGCNIVVSWSGDTACAGQVFRVSGPGFGTYPSDPWETVTAPSSRTVDPTAYAEQFTLGADNGYTGAWYARLTDDAGNDWTTGAGYCVPPILTEFLPVDDTLECGVADLASTEILCMGYFCGNGFVIYDADCNFIMAYPAVENTPGYWIAYGSSLYLGTTTTYTAYAVATCKAGCNSLSTTITVDPPCACPLTITTHPDLYVREVSALAEAVLAFYGAFATGDCAGSDAEKWTGQLVWRTAPALYACYRPPLPSDAGHTAWIAAGAYESADWIESLMTLQPHMTDGDCYWEYQWYCEADGDRFSYRRSDPSPIGEYTLYSGFGALPATITIEGGATIPPDPTPCT